MPKVEIKVSQYHFDTKIAKKPVLGLPCELLSREIVTQYLLTGFALQ